MKIGLLGGSFDPVHLGHLLLAEGAREALALDRVVWVPARVPPHKRSGLEVGAEDRVRMVELAIQGNPAFSVSRVEIDRPGPSYTIDTVLQLQQQLGPDNDLYFLIGSDTAAELPTWRRIDELRRLVQFVEVPRPGSAPSQELRSLAVQTVPVSASDVRARVHAGRSIRYLVPEPVRAYIEQKGLYR